MSLGFLFTIKLIRNHPELSHGLSSLDKHGSDSCFCFLFVAFRLFVCLCFESIAGRYYLQDDTWCQFSPLTFFHSNFTANPHLSPRHDAYPPPTTHMVSHQVFVKAGQCFLLVHVDAGDSYKMLNLWSVMSTQIRLSPEKVTTFLQQLLSLHHKTTSIQFQIIGYYTEWLLVG